MKKLIITIAIIAVASWQNIFAQQGNLQFNGVMSVYFKLKNSLTIDNGDSVRAAAKYLFLEIRSVEEGYLDPEQKKIWMEYSEKLSYDAEHMKETNDIEHQREHFMSLSKNMFAVAKAFNTNATNIYYQFCPMANGGKGAYWLSETEEIHNPYFGKKMPTCGSTKETITPKQ